MTPTGVRRCDVSGVKFLVRVFVQLLDPPFPPETGLSVVNTPGTHLNTQSMLVTRQPANPLHSRSLQESLRKPIYRDHPEYGKLNNFPGLHETD